MTAPMQMGYDFDDPRNLAGSLAPAAGNAWWPGAGEGASPSTQRPPDWQALRARFAAIHALRRTLEVQASRVLPGGGFLAAGRAVLMTCRPGERPVNPFRSANSKAAAGIDCDVAASPTPGDRGLE